MLLTDGSLMITGEVSSDGQVAAMTLLILLVFLVGILGGTLTGGIICVRYLGHQLIADVEPRLKRIQLQLENLDSEMNLALATRHAELAARDTQRRTLPPSESC